jgi:hypothetical protein
LHQQKFLARPPFPDGRDGAKIGSSATAAFTDATANVGTYTYYVTAVNSSYESVPTNSTAR